MEAMNEGDEAGTKAVLADECPAYENGVLNSEDPDGFWKSLQAWREALPDARFTVEDMILGPDQVASRVTVTGTHLGEFEGIAPTNRAVRITGMAMHRVSDGKITEEHVVVDTLGFMQQIGALPT